MHPDGRTDRPVTLPPADSPPARPVVAVVDDASLTRALFGTAFPSLDVAGTFASVDELLARRPQVDLVVLDLHLSTSLQEAGVLQGPAAIRLLRAQGLRVCLYTDERRPLVLAQCLAAGAAGIARKSDPLPETEDAFARVARGETVISRSLVGLAEVLSRRGRLPALTERQCEVLAARARGEKWELLARRLNISVATATGHLETVMAKMVWFLQDAGLDPDASPGDVERALGLAPGDLVDPLPR